MLLVVSVPLAGAGGGSSSCPSSLTHPQAIDSLEESCEEGMTTAGEGARQAQERAETARDTATAYKHSTIATVDQRADDAHELFGDLLLFAGDAVDQVSELLKNAAQPPQTDRDSSRADWAPNHVEAESAVAEPDSVAAGVAMVVAAGAVGGALLWWTAAQRVFLFGLIPLLSRIAHSEIYTNTARRLISDLVVQNPGLSLNEVVSRTGYSRNAVSYHLFVLEKEEELVSLKDGKYRRYFPRGGKYVNGAKNVVSALRNDTTLKMAQHIVARPGAIQREICQLLGTTASAACWHAKRLEDLQVIRKERVANTVQYFPGDALRKYDLSEFGLATPAAPSVPGAPMAMPAMH